MRKQKFDRVKKTLTILLLVLMVLSLTAALVSSWSSEGKAKENQTNTYVRQPHSYCTDPHCGCGFGWHCPASKCTEDCECTVHCQPN